MSAAVASVVPPTTDETEMERTREEAVEDAKIEQLLSEKLMDGYVLMEDICPNPKCAIPLVKNNKVVPRTLSRDENDPPLGNSIDHPVVVPSQSFEQPFKPVNGVPVCVGCNSHVITQEMELAILEDSDAFTERGSVYVALQKMSPPAPEKPEAIVEESATEPSTVKTEDNTNTSGAEEPEIIHLEDEIIHLEDVTEDDVLVGQHRHKVDIHASSFDMDGMSNIEVAMSPRVGDAEKPIDVEALAAEEEEEKEERSVRREIATKVLGAKMLQGWTLKEKTCESCAMPLMEHGGKEDCPVCPALAKRAKKMLKQKQRIEAEKARLLADVEAKKNAANAQQALQEKVHEFEELQTVRGEIESKAIREDEEAILRAADRKKAIEEEKNLLLKLQEQQQKMEDRDKELQEKQEQQQLDQLKADAAKREADEAAAAAAEEEKAKAAAADEAAKKEADEAPRESARVLVEGERIELERLGAIAAEEEQRRIHQAELRAKEEELAKTEAEGKALQEAAAQKLAEEKAAIEAFDEATMADDKTEAIKKDRLVEEHRKNMEQKITLDEQVAKLEEERMAEAMEARRQAEERRMESESRMIAALEADAAIKALAAEEAIRKAKEALKEVTSTKKQIITQTIELAEKEVVVETEDTLKARFEEHNEPVILQTKSQLFQERWETLRLESRAIMTRRVLLGWKITPEACVVEECHNTPLIEKNGKKECTVCGGCGDGTDVADLMGEAEPAPVVDTHTPSIAAPKPVAQNLAVAAPGFVAPAPIDLTSEPAEAAPAPVTTPKPVVAAREAVATASAIVAPAPETGFESEPVKEDPLEEWNEEDLTVLEQNREKYIKEIGKKLLKGWTLIDETCDTCVMPLMMDTNGKSGLCIACGDTHLRKQQTTFDASTIATKDMAVLEDESAPASATEARPLSPVAEQKAPGVGSALSEESDLVSSIQKQAPKQQPKRKQQPKNVDPPAFKATLLGGFPQRNIPVIQEEVITLPEKVDFADAAAIRRLVGDEQQRDDDAAMASSIDTVANLFLKSPHGYDFQDFGKTMNVQQVKELVEIFLVTNVDKDVSDAFKLAVAERILEKMELAAREKAASPRRTNKFSFDDVSSRRSRPFPEVGSGSPRKGYRSPRKQQIRVIGGPSPSAGRYGGMRSPRSDAGSVYSRASTVASEAMESIYDRIDQCKLKLLDPSNNLDEQIATAALLEKLAQAAVAVREMEVVEE